MFLGGIYHEGYNGKAHAEPRWQFYMSNIYGYLIILSMCILERVCLRWLKDRFGCDENAYDIIDQF